MLLGAPTAYWALVAGLVGLALGSFATVVVSRWPEGGSLVSPRSHCTSCQRTLSPLAFLGVGPIGPISVSPEDSDLSWDLATPLGPVPAATLVRTVEELLAFCREHLARQKVPRSIDFEDELPRLPTGKLYKRQLRDRYWAEGTNKIV